MCCACRTTPTLLVISATKNVRWFMRLQSHLRTSFIDIVKFDVRVLLRLGTALATCGQRMYHA
jgi:hypothetical protein